MEEAVREGGARSQEGIDQASISGEVAVVSSVYSQM